MQKYQEGEIVRGIVSGIEPYGVFVKIDDEYCGLIHISEVSKKFVQNISDYVKLNEIIKVKILSVDEKHSQLTLSIKDISYKLHNNGKKVKIIETEHGFNTLAYKLPFWIKENIKNHKKKCKFY